MKKISFAIIGGGPAGFYVSKLLSKLACEPRIDIYQKELCPFGLIRYGVAPDHISIKKSQVVLSEVIHYPFFRYFGFCSINQFGINQFKQIYSGVVYAYGASSNNIPNWLSKCQGRSNYNIKIARDLVYWYNGHPSKQNQKQGLQNVKNVVMIGNGNVSIDIARILLRDTKQLQLTQISQYALDQLKNCQVKNIEIIARRGVTHSAFAVKEVRQLHNLGFKLYSIEEELQACMNFASEQQCTKLGNHLINIVRINKRKVNFIKDNFIIIKEKDLQQQKKKQGKKIFFRYLLNPIKVSHNQLICQKTTLYGQPFKQEIKSTDIIINVKYDLLVISTGFQVCPIKNNQFNSIKKQIYHSDGCVTNQFGKVDVGSYAVGWCKTGPKGVLDQTLLSCEQTFNNIRIHVQKNLLTQKNLPKQPQKYISFEKYAQVREIELGGGKKQKYIKKKMSNKQLLAFYGLENFKCQEIL